MSDENGGSAFFYDSSEITGHSMVEVADMMQLDDQGRETLFAVFGRDLVSKELVSTEGLHVYLVTVPPNEGVKPHRHGTTQMTYILRGELRYGNKVTGPGMGYFSPNRYYTWTAGPEGCEYLEIHAGGQPGMDLKEGELTSSA